MLVDAVIFAIAGYSLVFAIAVVVSASNCAMGAVVCSDQSRCFVEYILFEYFRATIRGLKKYPRNLVESVFD